MQVVGLARPLKRTCSRLHRPAACGYLRFSRQNLASEAAVRTYFAGQLCYAARDGRIDSLKSGSDVEHPLAIGKLRNLAPDVPHTFFSRSTSPYFNLAVEHHLLTYSHPSSRILFTYTNTPCVVIGRNQNPWVECDIRTITKGTSDGRHVQLIRRRSGGGTVFHDEGNLNYTVVVPGDGFERRTHVQMVVDALAALREKQNVSRRWNKVRVTDRNDIVACLEPKHREDGGEENWFKVSGTAFKLTRGRALHHGTLLHSSPYIDSIGTFLRSPGKDYITAKGVESVRSPVTNLWNVTKHRRRRDMTTSIRKAIERMWAQKYAVESVVPPDAIQVAEGQPEDLIPELMSGLQELRTDSWRWDQTPGFSFDSREIVMAGQRLRLTFEVKNGLVQSVQTSEVLQARYEQFLLGQSIRELSAPGRWEGLLTDEEMAIDLQRRLIEILQLCFPPLKSKDNLENGIKKQKNSDITLETSAEPNFDARGNLRRDIGDDQPAARAG
jgi:lipoate-protein ligase A